VTTAEVPTPERLVFRCSPIGVLAALVAAVCVTPVAVTVPGMLVLYLLPVGAIYLVLRIRTTVAADGLVIRRALRTTRVAWSDVTALRLGRSRLGAVLSSGAELPLPAVRVRDLPLLARVSGGRLPDPETGRRPEPPAGEALSEE
jgi:hypothetical protein